MTTKQGTLLAHCGATSLTREQLVDLPRPESMGPRHKPIPHHELVECIEDRLASFNYEITRQEFATYGSQADRIFGVMDLKLQGFYSEEQTYSLGFRSGNDQSMSIKIGVGRRIFVCDNMVFAADLIALTRKHTSGIQLGSEITGAIARFRDQQGHLSAEIDEARKRELHDNQAKLIVYRAVQDEVIRGSDLKHVHRNYFEPEDSMMDCQGRTAWALHNAFTRVLRGYAPAKRFDSTARLGRRLLVSDN